MLPLQLCCPRIHDHNALDHITQFAHITGPGILHKNVSGVICNFPGPATVARREFFEEVLDQKRNVLNPFPQWRNIKGNHVQPIEEIFAKVAARALFFEILVCGGDYPHIDRDRLSSPDRRESLLVQCAQHLGLSLQTHVPDFVQEQRASIGAFKRPDLLG